VNLFIGMAALPVAFRLLPSRHDAEEHRLDLAGNLLLTAVLLLILVPLVEGRVSGWPAWSWLLLGLAVLAAAALVTWELRLERRGGEPVIQVGLLRERRAFGPACFAVRGRQHAHRVQQLPLLPPVRPQAVLAGISAMLVGQALIAVALRLSGNSPDFWALTGPLLLAGLGNGLVIAPNQDFVLASVPREQAGTAGGALITAQRLGAAIGIAVSGTALFGSGSGGGGGSASTAGKVVPALVHSAQTATLVNLCFIALALACAFGLPTRLAGQNEEPEAESAPGEGERQAPRTAQSWADVPS
jgi:hypothetical protein